VLTPSRARISSPLATSREQRPYHTPNRNVTYVIRGSHSWTHQETHPSNKQEQTFPHQTQSGRVPAQWFRAIRSLAPVRGLTPPSIPLPFHWCAGTCSQTFFLAHTCTQVHWLSHHNIPQPPILPPHTCTHHTHSPTPSTSTLLTFTYTQVLWFQKSLVSMTESRTFDVTTRPVTRLTIISTRTTQCM
jgi:hypothetical protein